MSSLFPTRHGNISVCQSVSLERSDQSKSCSTERFIPTKTELGHAHAMTTTMGLSVMLTVLIYVSLLSHGVQCSKSKQEDSLRSGVHDLPWQDQLCCDSPAAHLNEEIKDAHAPATNHSGSNLPHHPRCDFKSSVTGSQSLWRSGGTCLDILCRLQNPENLTCKLQPLGPPSSALVLGPVAISLQRLPSETDENPASYNPVVCEAEDSFTCSLTLDATTSFVTTVTVSISDTVAPPVLLQIPARPGKPSPPVNLSHIQTIEPQLILLWDDPSEFITDSLTYEVRYSSDSSLPAWQVVPVLGEPRLSLDLKPRLNYTIQVRCSSLDGPPVWSEWSEPHHIFLDTVSYIPWEVVARPGENVTVYCVFNDHNLNASAAVWTRNFYKQLHHSQYHPVNQWVSQITIRPSETRMYDLLQCTQKWNIVYSRIYVEGATIDINCETNGDINAMDCSWKNTQWTNPNFRSRWADLPCDVMEERERAGETVGEVGPACLQVRFKRKTCTIQPLKMNCYKLWLEVPSKLGLIRSKPVYLSPIDHVKLHTPIDVKAVTRSGRILSVSWKLLYTPFDSFQCQFRYCLPSTRAQLQWKVESPSQVQWGEVTVPDMCWVYAVQVRCIRSNGTGYWSKWSDSVYSMPQNSRAPERGPDFWRILQDDPYSNQTNATLLFEPLQMSGQSYCVDGLIIQHQTSSGSVVRERIDVASSYSFEWDQSPQTVTVEAYNSLGSSVNNFNMVLERQPKRRCLRSFTVLAINSTCVSLSWTLLDNNSLPLYMVVQWSPKGQEGSDHHKSGETWARLPYTDRSVHLRGDFFDSKECFHLYPVFADGEGEPMYTTATTRGDPAAYMMLMIVSFLSIVLFVTLVLTQNQMKKFVWKDVPNPSKCSWARGLDFKKVDNFDHLFQPPEGLPAWPLLLPSENISKVVIVDRVDLSALTTALNQTPRVSLTPDAATALSGSSPPGFHSQVDQALSMKSEMPPGRAPSFVLNVDDFTSSNSGTDQLQLTEDPPGSTNSSAQSTVTYATVLLSNPTQDHLHYKDGGGSSSSDEGNFSANNSDISGSFPGGLWELGDPRRSCSYNSVEELSETSEQDGEEEVREEKDLYYLGMDYPEDDEESEGDEEQSMEETKTELLRSVALNREDSLVESHPLLGPEDSSELCELLSTPPCDLSPLYMPQYRTSHSARQLAAQHQDSKTPAVTALK
ncbi:leptin receptor isoform X1 [Xyrichtys novacula]|uniref:Leptin receptor isoform X1 n=1 Tax=Xyrichtys novacula TaxID=13765 RepID=A0AAV1FIH9_XYRNO|nr:leptin receptor isoform X1 [Xyrichtys novacula]